MSNDVSTAIANTAESLQEWTAHTGFFKLGYDFGYHLDESSRVIPQIWVYSRVPFNGKRSAMFTSVGVIASLEF